MPRALNMDPIHMLEPEETETHNKGIQENRLIQGLGFEPASFPINTSNYGTDALYRVAWPWIRYCRTAAGTKIHVPL